MALGGFLVYAHFAQDLPSVDRLRNVGAPAVTRFYAADGQLAGEWYRERRIHLTWEEMPKKLILAFLAAEEGATHTTLCADSYCASGIDAPDHVLSR